MAAQEHRFDFDGDMLALDFLNTVSGMRGYDPKERILGYGDLISWARQAGIVDKPAASRLAKDAESRPAEAAARYARALQLREALFATVQAALQRRAPPAQSL